MRQVTALIRVNTPTLLNLTIGDICLPVCNIDCHAFFNSLRGLHNLVELNCGDGFEFRLTDVATFWPRLARLRTWVSCNGNGLEMARSVPNLRSLVIRNPIYLQNVVEILSNLPNLEHLEVAHIYNTYDPVQIRQTMDRTNPPRAFKSLTFKVIATHLPQLEVFIDTRKPESIHYYQMATESNITLGLVLQSCPNLKVFDALGHRFNQWQMMAPWVCTKLETLRCQIQGLRRLHVQQELTYSRTRVYQKQGRRLNERRVRVLERHQVSLKDHALVYNQLARLTQLWVVEIGFDHRQQRCPSDCACLHQFMKYTGPSKRTPEFSLESGLGLLSGLKDLEVFGFEGIDHHIGTKELDWMSENWPRLRMLRGLEEDNMSGIRFGERKAVLRDHLRQYLNHPTLATCIRVSRLWYTTLLPYLYASLDDKTCAWPKILTQLLPGTRRYPGDWTEDFIRAVILKHGGLIRHLTVQWALFNNAVSAASEVEGSCRRLRSLEIFPMSRAARYMEQTCFTTYRSQILEKSTWDKVEPLLSPLFAGAFRPTIHTALYWSQQDWITFQRFWMLVHNNRMTLQRLRLDSSIGRMKGVPEEFYDILASCPNLRYLENNYLPLDLQHLLDSVPQLVHLVDQCTFLNKGVLSRPMPHLRILKLMGQLSTNSLFHLLKYLPNLDQLFIGWEFVDFSVPPGSILENTKSRLQELHFISPSIESADDYIATALLPWLPNLKSLTLSCLGPCVASAVPLHCPSFESFNQLVLTPSIHPSYHMKTAHNTIAILLESCPNLKSVDAIQHVLHTDYLLSSTTQKWSCTETLETLRCQIRGISRLIDTDSAQALAYRQGCINLLIDEPLTPVQEIALSIYEIGHDHQQPLLYARLATLTSLRTLDLGMEYRDINNAYGRDKPYYNVRAKRYIHYGNLLPDTLELSLSSGLDQLKTLKKLEVFGFEGCNHRIGEEELKWMAENWPRLKEMRGLQPVKLLCLERDIPTERLLRFMKKLKPYVKHRRCPSTPR
ncbi:hypothetical protein BGZ97_003844 [Linnemannia gamsii]|uniref:Uncharacterized protein n=1 Tax=Linnemannia gamsii TaxID=64522 RepID=A0A9P6UT05_9FUNG|nr:hypothetical protein BGZ97_003844 [Linnemannia gamsii]